MRHDIADRFDEIIQWVSERRTKAWISEQLGCKPHTLNSWLDRLGIEYDGNQGAEGQKHSRHRKSALEYLRSTHVKAGKARQKLIVEGYKEPRCEHCGAESWMGQDIPLELHHVDGNRFNWDLSNIEILCPNCHALTENFSAKNIGSYT